MVDTYKAVQRENNCRRKADSVFPFTSFWCISLPLVCVGHSKFYKSGTAQKSKLQQGTPEYSSQLQAEIWGAAGALCLWLWLLQFAHKTPDFIGKLQPPALGCYCLLSDGPGKPISSSETERTVLFLFCPERHNSLWHTSGSSIPARSCSHRRAELAESLVYVSLSFQPQRDKHPNNLCYYIQQSKSSFSFTDNWNLRSEIWSVLRVFTCPLYLLLQEGPAEGHPLLKITQLPIMLGFCLHLDFTLICVQ